MAHPLMVPSVPRGGRHIPAEIVQALEASGRRWRIENGGKHRKLFIEDRLVTVLPFKSSDSNRRGTANIIAAIRRAARD